MPQIEISNEKGLIQKTGKGLVALPLDTAQAPADNATIATGGFHVQVNPAGAVANIVLEKPQTDGQLLLLSNIAAAENTVTFDALDAEPSSNFSLGAVTLEGGESVLCVGRGDVWYPTSQTLA